MEPVENKKLLSSLATKKLNNYRIKFKKCTLICTRKRTKYKRGAAVLLLLGYGSKGKVNIFFTKRSSKISQPGDLCCPGGLSIFRLDYIIARALRIEGSLVTKWPCWQHLGKKEKEKFTFFLSTALRESFEEIKLNPLGLKLIGVLPTQYFKFGNVNLHPFVCVTKQERFFLNSEVDKIVTVPIAKFFAKKNYSMCKSENF